MKILTALTYYRPHISGLTIYTEKVCNALVERGHEVTILTSQYDKSLPLQEVLNGVRIFRVPVAFRVSKGVIMPTIGWHATRMVLQHDVIHLHLPQLDASGIALRGQLIHHPVVLTYHSDLTLPPSPFHRVVERVVKMSNHVAFRLADAVVTNTSDFAEHSPFVKHYLNKVTPIFPPIEISPPSTSECIRFREKYQIEPGGPIIGIAARMAAEKGIEYLIQALPHILDRYPAAKILQIGPREPVGESAYSEKLKPIFAEVGDRYRHLGAIPEEDKPAFFGICDVNVLPSLNNTETFGMVQIEAAFCGTPSVASNLPGVRIPTNYTGMGITAEPGDIGSLSRAICEVLENRQKYQTPKVNLADDFSPMSIAEKYEALFLQLLRQ